MIKFHLEVSWREKCFFFSLNAKVNHIYKKKIIIKKEKKAPQCWLRLTCKKLYKFQIVDMLFFFITWSPCHVVPNRKQAEVGSSDDRGEVRGSQGALGIQEQQQTERKPPTAPQCQERPQRSVDVHFKQIIAWRRPLHPASTLQRCIHSRIMKRECFFSQCVFHEAFQCSSVFLFKDGSCSCPCGPLPAIRAKWYR